MDVHWEMNWVECSGATMVELLVLSLVDKMDLMMVVEMAELMVVTKVVEKAEMMAVLVAERMADE